MQAEFPNRATASYPDSSAHRLRCEHRRMHPGTAARGAAEPKHSRRVHRGAGDKIEARPVKTGARIGDSWLIEQDCSRRPVVWKGS